ncbi:MAG: SDR family oxidoreductase [Rhizobiales bacterium]|nr:SDR family oxidoreductase [Hyphomicrobiales bacterium]
MSELAGRRALVTGAGGGMGQAIVQALRTAGAKVSLADVSLEAGPDDICLEGDLTDGLYCDGLPALAAERLGGLDIVVNNAGVMRRGAITEATDEDLALSLAVNVEAPFRICRAAIPLLAGADKSAIVNVASCWGVHPGPNHLVYCMTKAALASMTQCLGRDHANQGIRVNGVCPNEVDTPMLRTGFEIRGLDPASAISELDKTVPVGRVAQPADIADVVVFLCSDQARYMCGSLVEVNGGKPVS